jgi:ADP-heptose:LPS heptosyltransferase
VQECESALHCQCTNTHRVYFLKILFFSHDGKLGDAVVNTAFLRGARLLDPTVELHVLASGNSGNLWQHDPRIARVWTFENPPVLECLRTSWAIRRERFDFLVTFKERFRSEKTRILLALAAPTRGVLYEEGKLAGQVTHAVRKSQMSLQTIYGDAALAVQPRYEMHFSKTGALPAPVAQWPAQQSFILVNMFGSEPNQARTLPGPATVELLQRLAAQLPGVALVLSCTHSTQEQAQGVVDAALQAMSSGFPQCGNLNLQVVSTDNDLPGLLALCARASVIISPDTSLIHIASALDKPVVGIYQNDGIKSIEWAPLCTHSAVVLGPDRNTVHGFAVDEVVRHGVALYHTVHGAASA